MKTSFAASAIGVVISLGLAACESPSSPDTDASASPGFTVGGGGGAEKVAVCHVGTQQPAYDPTCPTCGDAGKVDLLFLPASVARKHLEQGHDGQLVDYDPFAEGATGVGQEDTSDDGKYVDDGCVIPEDPGEIIYAVAYIDTDPDDGGYDANKDKLIAKLIDGENEAGDGKLGIGDIIVMGEFPVKFDLSTIGSFNTKQHTVMEVIASGVNGVIVRGANGLSFQWYHDVFNEAYAEGNLGNSGEYSSWIDRTEITGFQDPDEIIIGNSPSMPDTGILPDNYLMALVDNQFIDVEIIRW